MSRSMPDPVLWVATAVWLALVGLGLGILLQYSKTPGKTTAPPALWPADSRVQRSDQMHTLVLAAHPRCPCTRATISELDAIMARAGKRLSVHVLFVVPKGLGDTWAKSDLWRHAQRIPGVHATLDPLGVESRRFGALTSGQSALYGPDGRLVFSGGITGSRGHPGPNAGRSAVLASVESGARTTHRTPVYGCLLDGPASHRCEEATSCRNH
jgi:hypothetical protein